MAREAINAARAMGPEQLADAVLTVAAHGATTQVIVGDDQLATKAYRLSILWGVASSARAT